MKRDWDLLRWILNEAESCKAGYPLVLTIGLYGSPHYALNIGKRDYEEVCEHMLYLGDQGLAEVRSFGRTQSGSAGVVIDRLTMTGHDFLEAARDNTRWNKAKKIINEKGSTITIGVLTQLLTALMKESIGL